MYILHNQTTAAFYNLVELTPLSFEDLQAIAQMQVCTV